MVQHESLDDLEAFVFEVKRVFLFEVETPVPQILFFGTDWLERSLHERCFNFDDLVVQVGQDFAVLDETELLDGTGRSFRSLQIGTPPVAV